MLNEFAKEVQQALFKKGINPVVGNIHTFIQQWLSWYRGNVNDFHYYKKRINKTLKKFERLTMNLPKTMCENWAGYIWNEDSIINVDKQEIDKELQRILKDNNFRDEFVDFIEMVEALGGGAILCYPKNNTVSIDFIYADDLLITEYKNGIINGIITYDYFERYENKKKIIYNHLTHHHYKDGVATISHYLYKSKDNKTLGDESTDFHVLFNADEVGSYTLIDGSLTLQVESNYPFFQYFKPKLKNNWDIKSPYGISRFANAIDDIKKCDLTYDISYKEVKHGESKLFFDSKLSEEMVIDTNTTNPDGTPAIRYVRYFDSDNENFMQVDGLSGPMGDKKALEVFNPQLRVEQLDLTMMIAINFMAFKFGLGSDYFELKGGKLTAKEVVHSNSKLWRNVVKAQNSYGDSLKKLVVAILNSLSVAQTDKTIETIDDLDDFVTVNFDDSIVIDDESEKDRMLQLINDNILPKWHYLVKFMGYTEVEAKAIVKEAEDAVMQMINNDVLGDDTEEEEVDEDGEDD